MNREGIEAGNGEDVLLRRLERHPAVKARVARMLDLIENTGGDLKLADDAERQAIEELRRRGQELLGEWGQGRADEEARQMKGSGQAVRQVKKLRWYSTFGEIEVIEQTYLGKHDGRLKRPFAQTAGVRSRGYSGPLQRVVVDFGADNAFGRVPEKLAEHYGITLPRCAAATLTERHAHALSDQDVIPPARAKIAPLSLIAETDGSMIPVVEAGKRGALNTDRRKQRTLFWKEARLSLARRPDEVEPIFAVTVGDASAAGLALKRLADAGGLTRRMHVHGVGDGASWIAEQMEIQFGAQGAYLIDFFHLCEYLAAAAPVCDPEHPKTWMNRQKEAAKRGGIGAVMAALASHLEHDTVDNEQAPVRRCHRYIANRPGQFNYPEAIAAGLPIGSGEVESAHRYVIQDRLKLPGAWWRLDNAEAMLRLRALRANHLWMDYWHRSAA